MDSILEFFKLLLSSEKIIQTGSVLVIFLIVFCETGIIFTFFLPGDYLLFLAGMYCTTLKTDIATLSGLILLAAVLGYFTGYIFGRKIGGNLYKRKDSRFFKRKHLDHTEAFFHKYGKMSIIIARFLPVVRTFMPVLAGVIKFPATSFALLNIAGGIIWVGTMVIGGYYLGNTFPQLKNHVEWIILFFISITTFTVIRSWLAMRKKVKEK